MKNSQEKRQSKLPNQIKSGDIYKLGEHFLACGDARDETLVKKLIRDNKIKLILTDVPYGVAYVEGKREFSKLKTTHKEIANDEIQSEEQYQRFTNAWLESVKPHLDSKNAYYIFNSDKMIFSLREALIKSKFKFTQLLIWIKTHSVIGRLDYLPQHELIAYGWYGTHEFLKSKDKSILIYPKPNKSKLHATMKPVGLLRRLILNSTRIGDIIYEPFCGSGSTLIAAEHTRRRCFAIEIEPSHCQTILDRFEKLTGIKPVLINNL